MLNLNLLVNKVKMNSRQYFVSDAILSIFWWTRERRSRNVSVRREERYYVELCGLVKKR